MSMHSSRRTLRSTITDCSPSKLHGALLGTQASLKWIPGHNATSGTAVDLDGDGACFDIGAALILEFANKTFTVTAWLKVRDFDTSAGRARRHQSVTHVAVIYDGAGSGSMKIHVNGTLANTNPGPHVLAPALNGVGRLGCKSLGDKVLNGAVDDLRIYARALTDNEIAALAQP